MMARLLLAACLMMVGASLRAEEFPSRTVTIISPYQAGGTSDIIARILAQKLQERWGKPVIVENRAGANGGIGVSAVAHAAPDGHTLLAVASSALTINPTFYPNLPYDVDRDLAPITRTGMVANVLVVTPSLPAKSVSELIALAKEKPGQLSYASQGIGSNGQVTGEMFKQRTRTEVLHVPYKGSAPAVQDLLAGHVQVMFDNLPSVLQFIRAGQLRALAVTTAQRAAELPDVPTLAEWACRSSRPARGLRCLLRSKRRQMFEARSRPGLLPHSMIRMQRRGCEPPGLRLQATGQRLWLAGSKTSLRLGVR